MSESPPDITTMRGLDAALEALATIIQVAADEGSDAAIEFAADWLNAHDAVDPEDQEAYLRWQTTVMARGRQ